MSPSLLRIENLRKWYEVGGGFFGSPEQVRAVDGVSMELEKGEVVSVVGESGCGKTTFGKTSIRLLEPTDGRILFDGKDITHLGEGDLDWLRRETGLIQQDPYSTINPSFPVYRALEEPLLVQGIGDSEERTNKVHRALEDVELVPPEAYFDVYPHTLSGGERQRVGIARSIILGPQFVFADEPVSMLDPSVKVEILELFEKLRQKSGITFLHATHDLATSRYFSHRIAIMYSGEIVEEGPPGVVLGEPLHPYTNALIEAVSDPDPANRFEKRKIIPGEPPDLVSPPDGCRFHPRCPKAFGDCKENNPYLENITGNHKVACHLYD